ncbi:neuronal acetylcholine receptor subunit alpha-5-like [Coccinella septempunctata]|uniref:neuronal acetylcholine receptor subunit alpha-5-like n=1 Tax=Coccinella septempunctata TaxID=41139 RepID=UPI001D0900D0|nr:neuronal acetylcholine receptor subunit alpha-5-like [Coccinella septempunctata]
MHRFSSEGFATAIFAFLCFVESVIGGFTTKVGPQPIWNATYTDKLRQDLLLNYDKFARPMQHYNTTLVRFGLALRHFEVNEFKSQLTVYTWVRMTWTDEKLKWNPKDYGEVDVVRLADHEIWQPDLFLYNSAVSSAVGHYANTHFLVYPNGEVLWVPPCQFTVLCDLNLLYWPFDIHTCSLKFGSWTYSGDHIDLELYNNTAEIEKDLTIDSTEWELLSASMEKGTSYYPCCEEPYPYIAANITIARRSPSYKAIIITPAFAILVLILSAFWLPPNAGEKLVLNGCVAVLICLFLLYFTQKIPAMGLHIPLIVLFYSNCLYVVSCTMIGSVVVIWLSRTKHSSPLPWVIKKPLTGSLGKWLGLTSYINQSTLTHRVTAEEMRDHHVTDLDDHNSCTDDHIFKPTTKLSVQQDWVLLAAAIDRISFCFYCLVSLIMAVQYSL